jgi:predicted MFS family arabinose efflux permease
MTTSASIVGEEIVAGDAAAAPPTPLSNSVRGRILIYLGVLVMLLGFGAPYGGLIDTPISFFLKNKLHLDAHQIADFRLLSGIPLYLSFVFGFARDTWNPFGMRDRGFLVLFGAACAAIYVYFAFTTPNATTLLIAVVLLTTAFLFVASAQAGLSSVIGQQQVMSGQVSTVWNIFLSVPTLAAFVAGGLLSDQLEGKHADQAARVLFLLGAGFMAAIAIFGVFKPRSVYDNVRYERAADAHPWDDFVRLLRHWPIYPALFIWLLWNFAPGSVTPLQFYMQNTLHSNDAAFANWNAIFAASFIPTFMVFGVLCRKVALRRLLFWGTVVAVPQMVPLILIHTVTGALIAAVPIGLMGGVATAAYLDLLIRSCPPGLQGTLLMASNAAYYLVSRLGDRLGTELYDHYGGFPVCVAAITIVYALILPVLFLVPKHLTATPDGEAIGAEERQVFS